MKKLVLINTLCLMLILTYGQETIKKYYGGDPSRPAEFYTVGKDGMITGTYKSWYLDGTKEEESEYKKGEKNGTCIHYFEGLNTIQSKSILKDGYRNGRHQEWTYSQGKYLCIEDMIYEMDNPRKGERYRAQAGQLSLSKKYYKIGDFQVTEDYDMASRLEKIDMIDIVSKVTRKQIQYNPLGQKTSSVINGKNEDGTYYQIDSTFKDGKLKEILINDGSSEIRTLMFDNEKIIKEERKNRQYGFIEKIIWYDSEEIAKEWNNRGFIEDCRCFVEDTVIYNAIGKDSIVLKYDRSRELLEISNYRIEDGKTQLISSRNLVEERAKAAAEEKKRTEERVKKEKEEREKREKEAEKQDAITSIKSDAYQSKDWDLQVEKRAPIFYHLSKYTGQPYYSELISIIVNTNVKMKTEWNTIGGAFENKTVFFNAYTSDNYQKIKDLTLFKYAAKQATESKDLEDIINELVKYKSVPYYSDIVNGVVDNNATLQLEWKENGQYFQSKTEFYEAYTSKNYQKILKKNMKKK